jgi:hypothetical protein
MAAQFARPTEPRCRPGRHFDDVDLGPFMEADLVCYPVGDVAVVDIRSGVINGGWILSSSFGKHSTRSKTSYTFSHEE